VTSATNQKRFIVLPTLANAIAIALEESVCL